MTLLNDSVINITATEIQSVLTGAQQINLPLCGENMSDTTLQKVNLDGHEMTCLVNCNMRGDAALLIDIKTGIAYELFPAQVDTSREINLATEAEKAELNKLINLTA